MNGSSPSRKVAVLDGFLNGFRLATELQLYMATVFLLSFDVTRTDSGLMSRFATSTESCSAKR